MSKPLTVNDFAEVAEFLLGDPTEIDGGRWLECENARSRSAISRAYYGLFLYFKARLLRARVAWTFPTVDVHRKLHQALLEELGASHTLVVKFRTLLRHRKRADYELDDQFGEDEAGLRVDLCWDALQELQDLPESTIRTIANRLYDIEVSTH